jgi:micrococcal nuclease
VILLPLLFVYFALHSCDTTGYGKVNEYYTVVKIVDGDTFWIDDGTEKGRKIRLIGVDAPETRRSSRKEAGRYGVESKSFLTKLLSGKEVRLEYDVDPEDRYGRTLAYVYLEDGTFVNAELVRRGYAMVMTIPPNVKFAAQFLKLQAEAREEDRGLWKQEY